MDEVPKYHSVNRHWPEGTNEGRSLKPTPQEAVAAAKRLYRFAMKKPFKGTFKLTSGNRYTWIRNHVMHVNPDMRDGGWHELVHMMSHLCAHRLFPNAKGHSHQHAHIEREMIQQVVAKGWLEGKLKRPDKPAPDRRALKAASIEQRIKSWETKARRAATALRKLKTQQRRFAKFA